MAASVPLEVWFPLYGSRFRPPAKILNRELNGMAGNTSVLSIDAQGQWIHELLKLWGMKVVNVPQLVFQKVKASARIAISDPFYISTKMTCDMLDILTRLLRWISGLFYQLGVSIE